MNDYQYPGQQIIGIPDHGRLLPAVGMLFSEKILFPENYFTLRLYSAGNP